mgnify:CR=1 FL=1
MVSYDDLTDEQQRAVDALDRNVTLTAGAGTGKTTTLTARFLRMIDGERANRIFRTKRPVHNVRNSHLRSTSALNQVPDSIGPAPTRRKNRSVRFFLIM